MSAQKCTLRTFDLCSLCLKLTQGMNFLGFLRILPIFSAYDAYTTRILRMFNVYVQWVRLIKKKPKNKNNMCSYKTMSYAAISNTDPYFFLHF